MNERLLAVGDIHGCFDSFLELIERRIKLRKNDKIVLLGDYIDRGNQSREVVDLIMDLQNEGFNIIPLCGNHESLLLEAYEDERKLSAWLTNGGRETLLSFGIESVNKLGKRYLKFFRSLLSYYSYGRYLFVHAGFNDVISNPLEDLFQMLWSRRERYSNPLLREKIIIHGHTPIPLSICREIIQSGNNVINIDTGCVYSGISGYGYLSALDINTMELYSI